MQPVQQTPDGVARDDCVFLFGWADETEPRRHFNAGLQFGVRTESDAHMIGVGLCAPPAVTLGKIRRNRYCGTAQLTGQSVLFALRKRCGQPVALLNQVHSLFPGLEISVCEDCRHVATMSSIDARRFHERIVESAVKAGNTRNVPAPRDSNFLPPVGLQPPSLQPPASSLYRYARSMHPMKPVRHLQRRRICAEPAN
jgi:hypothetical protein